MSDESYEPNWEKASYSQLNEAFYIRNKNLEIDKRRRVQFLSIDSKLINEQIPSGESISAFFLTMALRQEREPDKSDFRPVLRVLIKGSENHYDFPIEATTLKVSALALLSEKIVTLVERKGFMRDWTDYPHPDLYQVFMKNHVDPPILEGYYFSSTISSNFITFNMLIENGRFKSGALDIYLGVKPQGLRNYYPYIFAPTFVLRPSSGITSIIRWIKLVFGGVEYIHPCPTNCPD
ncbi:MAG: hypothetical protein HEP71_15845 [Roseivirga sp.]|nr:hypothetical protein [Roseivirga sp.]